MTVRFAYPLPTSAKVAVLQALAILNSRRNPPLRAGRWCNGSVRIDLHPDDHTVALAVCQAVSVRLGLPPYAPARLPDDWNDPYRVKTPEEIEADLTAMAAPLRAAGLLK